jgi:hypothetical protein
LRVSSPYSAADSNPMNDTNASIMAAPADPLKTVCGANASTGSAAAPLCQSTPASSRTRIATSATMSTESTRADRSIFRYPSTATAAIASAE